MVCGELGRKDVAFQYLELAIAQHDDQVSFMAVDHRFDSLRDDPRFSAALRRVGLPVLAGLPRLELCSSLHPAASRCSAL